MLLVEAASVSSRPEVQLKLDTTQPGLFGFWHSMQQGFDAGKAGPQAPLPPSLPKPRLAAGSAFGLDANPRTPLLRYHEPSALRRVALLTLGAWSGGLSAAGLLLIGLGSWLLLQDVTPTTPFTPANAHRLLHLTLLVLGLNLWDYVARVAVLALVPDFQVPSLSMPLNHYVSLSADKLVPGFLTGFILFVVAAVYQRGVMLSQEAELVI